MTVWSDDYCQTFTWEKCRTKMSIEYNGTLIELFVEQTLLHDFNVGFVKWITGAFEYCDRKKNTITFKKCTTVSARLFIHLSCMCVKVKKEFKCITAESWTRVFFFFCQSPGASLYPLLLAPPRSGCRFICTRRARLIVNIPIGRRYWDIIKLKCRDGSAALSLCWVSFGAFNVQTTGHIFLKHSRTACTFAVTCSYKEGLWFVERNVLFPVWAILILVLSCCCAITEISV